MAETTLGNIHKQLTAAELIRGKMRLSIVQSLTGLTIRPLRTMWKEIHNEGPSNGKLPESVLSYMVNQAMAAGISTFTSLHLRQHSPNAPITAEGLLATWSTYQRLCGPMDINAGYYALRDVRADFVSFPRCTCCDAHFIYDPGSTLTSRCPFCGHSPAKDDK
ncbi:FlhC family transcriptional regulator [Acidovorax delafieldii]|uniref:FlhC family transcriptional regulator n=1 Tax=Acidovorax delafieldii TaxID=47920 RepID=UPI003F4FAEE4